jgi:signal transduction histidine kinase
MAETAPDPREALDARRDRSVALIQALCRIGEDSRGNTEDRLTLATGVVREALRADEAELWLLRQDGGFSTLGPDDRCVTGPEARRWRARLSGARTSLDVATHPRPALEAGIVGASGLRGALRCERRRGAKPWTAADRLLAALAADRLAILLEAEGARTSGATGLGAVVQSFAHDLGNTLTTALGHVQLAASAPAGLPRDESTQGALAALDFACQLSRQLIGLGDGRDREFSAVSLDDVVASVDRLLRSVLGRNRHLDLELEAGDLRIDGDPSALRRLLLNLVANARDATEPGGSIRIATRTRRRVAELTVRDDGVGMDESVRAHMFEPGFSTRRGDGGYGLGLAAVRAIVDAHGADIAVESAPGDGTTVTVRFPGIG